MNLPLCNQILLWFHHVILENHLTQFSMRRVEWGIILYNCLSYLNLIGQLEGENSHNARPCLYRCSLLPVPIETRKYIINLLLQFLGSGNTVKFFHSRPRYHPSLQSGRCGRSQTEYFAVLPSQSHILLYTLLHLSH